MTLDDRIPAGCVVGVPQTFRERLSCAWSLLRYPGRVAIVYTPPDANAVLNDIRTARREMEITARKTGQLTRAFKGERSTKEATRLAKGLLASRQEDQRVKQEHRELMKEIEK